MTMLPFSIVGCEGPRTARRRERRWGFMRPLARSPWRVSWDAMPEGMMTEEEVDVVEEEDVVADGDEGSR